jgi:hypothetical protein
MSDEQALLIMKQQLISKATAMLTSSPAGGMVGTGRYCAAMAAAVRVDNSLVVGGARDEQGVATVVCNIN